MSEHQWVRLRTLTDEEQGNYVVWDAMYECSVCLSRDLDPGPADDKFSLSGECDGTLTYYGLSPEIWVERYKTSRPE